MASTGSLLRELRERQGVSLAELARITRIGQGFLEALEADEFARLPAGPFARGFIRAYCQALNEAPAEALARYAAMTETTGSLHGADAAPLSRVARRRNGAPVLISLVLLLVLAVALAAITLVLKPRGEGGGERSGGRRGGVGGSSLDITRPPPAAPAIEESRLPIAPLPPPVKEESRPSIVALPPAPRPVAVTRPSPARSYRLVARASHATSMRIRLDGTRTIEETLVPGAVREWVSTRPFELRISNAGGVTLELNGRVLPPLGPRGTTVHRLVLPAGLQ